MSARDSQDTEVKIDIALLRRRQPRFQGLESGHRACLGCGEALAARLVLESAGPNVMIATYQVEKFGDRVHAP